MTPLFFAIDAKAPMEIIKTFIEAGTDLNAQDDVSLHRLKSLVEMSH